MPPRRRIEPGPGQESVWDYPRPPSRERSGRHVQVRLGGQLIADSTAPWRVCETSHPPVYYLPRADIADGVLTPGDGGSYCEFKGAAAYWHVSGGGTQQRNAGWSYPHPTGAFAEMADAVAFYPALMGECTVDGEVVTAQAGGFYGGWITAEVVGPFKGEPGTWGW
ncbi:DUF427 domain-containing protein [soil metagenome]